MYEINVVDNGLEIKKKDARVFVPFGDGGITVFLQELIGRANGIHTHEWIEQTTDDGLAGIKCEGCGVVVCTEASKYDDEFDIVQEDIK